MAPITAISNIDVFESPIVIAAIGKAITDNDERRSAQMLTVLLPK